MNMMLTLLVISISLTGCSSMAGNVVPQKGPSMEHVYDSMEVEKNSNIVKRTNLHSITLANMTDNTFHKLPNPELKMYVYPHLAGTEEVPIPGYYTAFNAYTRDHYALPSESI